MAHGFLRNTTIVGLLTLLSRVTGVIRDMVYLISFGAGPLMDAFLVAFKIPNFMRRLTTEGAFSQAFVPVLAEYKNQRGPEATRDLVDHVTSLLALVLIAVTVLGMLAAPWIVYVSAPGFTASPDKFALTVELLRITFPYIFFISLVSLAGGVLNTYNKFSVPAFGPVWLNISFIVAALFFAPYFDPPIKVLAWAVFVGGALNEVVLNEDDAGLVRIAREQIGPLLGIGGEPLFARVNRYPRAMPQYLVGHARRVDAIEGSLARLPGLRLVGGAYRGVGIADCVRSGEEAADALLS